MSCRSIDQSCANDVLQKIDNVLLDCDGVLWNGNEVIPGSLETVEKLKKLGKRVYYVTNNSTKTRQEYVQKCLKLGYDAKEEEIACTAYIAALYLYNAGFKDKVYVVGNPGMGKELDNVGIRHIGITPDPLEDSELTDWMKTELDPEVKCVLVGFDPNLSYLKMLKAASYNQREGCIFLATNEDTHLPVNSNIVIPGTGSIVAAVSVPSRRKPVVLGKPEKTLFQVLQKAHGLDPSRTMMVGDRCNTDIAMATNCGLKSMLVFSGVTKLPELQKYRESPDPVVKTYIPTYYASSLGDLGKLLPDSNPL